LSLRLIVQFCAKSFSKGFGVFWKIFSQKGLFNMENILSKGVCSIFREILCVSTTLFKNFSCFRYANGLITSLLSALTLLKIDFSVNLPPIERKFSARGA